MWITSPPPQGTSLPPRESLGETPPPRIRWYNYWPAWRRTMMSGAVILLVGAIVRGIAPEEAVVGWVHNASLVIGYMLLGYGFFLSHRARREAIERAAKRRDREAEKEAASVLAAHDPPHDGTNQ